MRENSVETESTRSTKETGHWMLWHYLVLAVLTASAIWMAFFQVSERAYVAWLILMVSLIAFLAVAGHGIKGMWRGALIDEYNRLSLSRLQMMAWTVLVVAALGTLGVRQARLNPATGLDLSVPPEIWLLMGLSTTSLLASPAIKQSQSREPTPGNAIEKVSNQGARASEMETVGRLVANRSSRYARWSNLFMGETVHDAGFLDIAKVQMFFFTVLTLLTYGTAIGSGFLASEQSGVLPTGLPEFSEGMLTLLGISHGGYLAGKLTVGAGKASSPPAVPPSPPGPESSKPGDSG